MDHIMHTFPTESVEGWRTHICRKILWVVLHCGWGIPIRESAGGSSWARWVYVQSFIWVESSCGVD